MSRMRCLTAIAVAALLVTGCSGEMSTLDPAGEAAETLRNLSWGVYGAFLAVAAAVFGLILWPVVRRRRGSFDEHAPVGIGGGEPWILVGGFAVPFVVLAGVFVAGLQTMSAYPLQNGAIPAPEIVVTGNQWWWRVNYVAGPPAMQFETANEIHIPVDTLVDIEVRSADVIHSFWVPRLHGKVDLIPGMPNRIRLHAERAGVYRGQCAEFCGAQHAHMSFLVIAQPMDEYAAWLDHQRRPARIPESEEARHGLGVFNASACSMCHTIRGTGARGRIGPDLTHLASRRTLAANTLVNNRANLMAWVTHAQSLKPEVEMPNITQMTGEELRVLATFLEELE